MGMRLPVAMGMRLVTMSMMMRLVLNLRAIGRVNLEMLLCRSGMVMAVATMGSMLMLMGGAVGVSVGGRLLSRAPTSN